MPSEVILNEGNIQKSTTTEANKNEVNSSESPSHNEDKTQESTSVEANKTQESTTAEATINEDMTQKLTTASATTCKDEIQESTTTEANNEDQVPESISTDEDKAQESTTTEIPNSDDKAQKCKTIEANTNEDNSPEFTTAEASTNEDKSQESTTIEAPNNEDKAEESTIIEAKTYEDKTCESKTTEITTDRDKAQEYKTIDANNNEDKMQESTTTEVTTDEDKTQDLKTTEATPNDYRTQESTTTKATTNEDNIQESTTTEANINEDMSQKFTTAEASASEDKSQESITNEVFNSESKATEFTTIEAKTDEDKTQKSATTEVTTDGDKTQESKTIEAYTDEDKTQKYSTTEVTTDGDTTQECRTTSTITNDYKTQKSSTIEATTNEESTSTLASENNVETQMSVSHVSEGSMSRENLISKVKEGIFDIFLPFGDNCSDSLLFIMMFLDAKKRSYAFMTLALLYIPNLLLLIHYGINMRHRKRWFLDLLLLSVLGPAIDWIYRLNCHIRGKKFEDQKKDTKNFLFIAKIVNGSLEASLQLIWTAQLVTIGVNPLPWNDFTTIQDVLGNTISLPVSTISLIFSLLSILRNMITFWTSHSSAGSTLLYLGIVLSSLLFRISSFVIFVSFLNIFSIAILVLIFMAYLILRFFEPCFDKSSLLGTAISALANSLLPTPSSSDQIAQNLYHLHDSLTSCIFVMFLVVIQCLNLDFHNPTLQNRPCNLRLGHEEFLIIISVILISLFINNILRIFFSYKKKTRQLKEVKDLWNVKMTSILLSKIGLSILMFLLMTASVVLLVVSSQVTVKQDHAAMTGNLQNCGVMTINPQHPEINDGSISSLSRDVFKSLHTGSIVKGIRSRTRIKDRDLTVEDVWRATAQIATVISEMAQKETKKLSSIAAEEVTRHLVNLWRAVNNMARPGTLSNRQTQRRRKPILIEPDVEDDPCDPNPCGPYSNPTEIIQPCNPSPCGRNAVCSEQSGAASCRCIRDYIGNPYIECKPECIVNVECPHDKACLNQHCRDPCPGGCGPHASCSVSNHVTQCRCDPDFEGDPFIACQRITTTPTSTDEVNPCSPSPCGSNAVCKKQNRAASCHCIPEYFGDPYVACKPECTINPECVLFKTCLNLKCVDPCPGLCGVNAECRVIGHLGTCTCRQGYRGDPYTLCQRPPQQPPPQPQQPPPPPQLPPPPQQHQLPPQQQQQLPPKQQPPPLPPPQSPPQPAIDHCNPSPCGDNAVCYRRGGYAACECIPDFFGDPFIGCRPECVVNSHCPSNLVCQQLHCMDPCPGTCGVNAVCRVINHVPSCRRKPILIEPTRVDDPCDPNPCGPNSLPPQQVGDHCQCTCLPEMIGSPPNCRPECVVNSDCSSDKACIQRKCQDPCPGLCGVNAYCRVRNHVPICICNQGHIGDPFSQCRRPTTTTTRPDVIDPCNPSPCGINAECMEYGVHAAACVCFPGLQGDPYVECKHECTINPDCPSNRACINNKCMDACPGVCGSHAICSVNNHYPICRCDQGYSGDPFSTCYPKPTNSVEDDPCDPNPCGPNSNQLRAIGGHCQCSCLTEMIGSPPNCRPECIINPDCPTNEACVMNKCVDPCPGVCTTHATCRTQNHNPHCTCDPGYSSAQTEEGSFRLCTKDSEDYPVSTTPAIVIDQITVGLGQKANLILLAIIIPLLLIMSSVLICIWFKSKRTKDEDLEKGTL